eukprot:11077278-Prorocentrum_lima.AAC.1
MVAFQEHHLKGEPLRKYHVKLKAMGWSSWLGEALPTKKKGTTGGVGFAWKPYLDVCMGPRDLVAGR